MRKYAVLVLVLALFAVKVPRVSSQENQQFDYDRAYQDYVFTLDVYKQANSDYLLARAQYLQAGTLVAQTKARDATVKMLQTRDDVVVAYLNAIRMKLIETDGVPDVVRGGLLTRLAAEVSWFSDHKDRVTSAGSLDSLVADSDEALERFVDSEAVAYEALSTVAIGKVTISRNTLNDLLNKMRTKVNEIQAKGDLDLNVADRWLLEIDNKLTRSLDKNIEAENGKALFYESRSKNRLELYNEIIASIQESQQLVREGNGYMREILRSILQPF